MIAELLEDAGERMGKSVESIKGEMSTVRTGRASPHLLDRINVEIKENGLHPTRAIVESAQRRLRPIVLTTATTVGGLLPLWFGGGPMWQPASSSRPCSPWGWCRCSTRPSSG